MTLDTLADAIIGSGNSVVQMTEGRFAYNASVIRGTTSSGLVPNEYYGGFAEPKWTGTSRDIGGVLGIVDVASGLALSSEAIEFPFRKRAASGTFGGSSAHDTINCTDALVVATEIAFSKDDDATIGLEAYIISTDGTDPITINTAQTIAADAHNARWALGPVSINGTAIENVVNVSVPTGVRVKTERLGGNFPQQANIVEQSPTMTITFKNFAEAQGFAAAHTAMTAAIVYGRKRSGASFVANGTAQHVKLSFGDGLIQLDGMGAQQGADGTGTVTLFGESLTCAPASAIT